MLYGSRYEWSDNGTSLKPFENNPILGGGARAAYGVPGALPTGAGGIADVEMFYGPDGLLHAVGLSVSLSLCLSLSLSVCLSLSLSLCLSLSISLPPLVSKPTGTHQVGCPAVNASSASPSLAALAAAAPAAAAEFEQCHHYVNGGPAEVGATAGVQWYGPVGLSGAARVTQTTAAHLGAAGYPTLPWLRGATPVSTLHNIVS